MASGYSPDGFVWAIDRVAGQAYPIAVDHFDLTANPDRYELDHTHPVVDDRGVLLEAKPIADKAPKTTSNKPAAAGKES